MSDLVRPDHLVAEELKRRFGEEWLDFAPRWAPSQKRILASPRQYLLALGGNGAGKTTLGGWWLASEINGFNPLTGKVIERQHPATFYAVAPTDEKIDGLLKPALARWLAPKMILKQSGRKSDTWFLRDGVRVMWKTSKQDPMTFTGDEIDGGWLDEELGSEEHWKRILSRGFRRLARFLWTMTAENGTLWAHGWWFSPDEYPMDEKEIVSIDTRENPYYRDCDRCTMPEEWHVAGHAKQNKCCPKFDNTKGKLKLELRLRQCKGAFDFRVRIKGEYLLVAGSPVIDPDMRESLEKKHRTQPVCGYLSEKLKFVKLEDETDARAWLRVETVKRTTVSGEEKVFMLTPQRGHNYVIGVDAAEGNPTGDYHACVVIDMESGEQCALGHTRSVPTRDFGSFVTQLARWYNDAYVSVEANNHGASILDSLAALNYGNIYKRDAVDAVTKQQLNKGGFFTTNRTKKPAVDLMAMFFVDRMKIHDPVIYGEARGYVWLKENREGTHGVGNANPKGHDDTMTALFCASVALRRLGWATTSVEESPTRTYDKTVGDVLMEDASGRQMSEDEVLESAAARDASVQDVFTDDAEDAGWLP